MNIIQLDNDAAQYNRAFSRRPATRLAPVLPAAGFAAQIADLFTQMVFVATALGLAALLRYGAPEFPGRNEAAEIIDFGAACGVLHGLISLGKTCIAALWQRH